MLDIIKHKIRKSAVWDVQQFVDCNYLIDNKKLKIMKLNYRDLAVYIMQRSIDYWNCKIFTDHVSLMSLKFKNTVEDFEDESYARFAEKIQK